MVEKITKEIQVQVGGVKLGAYLHIPEQAKGIVLFAHGSGSSRRSTRNQFVAKFLQDANIATLLMDLLTTDEEKIDLVTQELRFDIPFLSDRLLGATEW
nr:putative phosphoribosyl transferase [Chlamydiota bacterium]